MLPSCQNISLDVCKAKRSSTTAHKHQSWLGKRPNRRYLQVSKTSINYSLEEIVSGHFRMLNSETIV